MVDQLELELVVRWVYFLVDKTVDRLVCYVAVQMADLWVVD
jgi:hypothetical protein